MAASGVDALAEALQQRLNTLADDDSARFFTGVYLRTTQAVGSEIAAGGFEDGDWVDRWDAAFGELFLRPFDAWRNREAGQPSDPAQISAPWRLAFGQWKSRPDLQPLNHVLVGINAHINYDLPQALLAVITPQEFGDEALLAKRSRDHDHINSVLARRVAAEDELLTGLGVSLITRVLTPLNRLATKRMLAESREKVWANARILAKARNASTDAYTARLAELERLSAARVAELTKPGQILLRLARVGFGVQLSPDLPDWKNAMGSR